MKLTSLLLFLLVFLSCNNQAGSAAVREPAAAGATVDEAGTGCGAALLFQKGVKMTTESGDGSGKVVATSVSEVTKVSTEAGILVAEVKVRSEGPGLKEPQLSTAVYRCDGQRFVMDLSGLMQNRGGMKMTSDGMAFPLQLTVGSTLPDAMYSAEMEYGGKSMKITSTIKDRKVEAKEKLVTPAGTFDCYKITAIMEVHTEMPGTPPELRKQMDEARAKMGKNTMVVWYDPAVTVLKFEVYTAGKLTVSNQVTKISK